MDGNMERPASPRRRQQSTSFRNALVSVPVPQQLLDGVNVLRVNASGRTRPSFLTLSEDKFTLYITTTRRAGSSRRLSILSLRRTKSEGTTLEKSIDIGAIDRVQRGQATPKFVMAKKNRQDSIKNLMSSPKASARKLQVVEDDVTIAALDPERSFSIIFRGERTLDLMTLEDDHRDDILNALDKVIQAYQEAKLKVTNEILLLRYIWLDVDKDKTNMINVNEIGRVCDRINFYMKKAQLNASYEKFTKSIGMDRLQRRKGMNFEQCCTFLHMLRRDTWMVKPVNVLWGKLFGEFMNNGKPRTTVSDRTFLEKFMHKKQKEHNCTLREVRKIFRRLQNLEIANTADSVVTDHTRIDKNRFEAYLLGRANDAFDPSKEHFDERLMTKPISEYWVSTSHNTYLTGDQLTSESKVEMYLFALNRGCRCLELDIWDGQPDPDSSEPVPIVYHGHTMTTKIRFADIIRAIKVYLNFHPDSYPIILSFENHCSIPYQEVMAGLLVDILGDLLYIPTEQSLFGRLPSPQDLRGLVVIKGRRPDGSVDAEGYDTDDDIDEEEGQEVHIDDKERLEVNEQLVKKHGVSPQLAKLTLFHGTKYKSWDESVMAPTHHMHSFSESKVRSLCRQTKGKKWAIYNQSHMTRTFPAGSRVDSSNYNPMLAWSQGCQLVALNFQTPDSFLRLNDGRFRENGRCGYVLKPSSLMVNDDFSSVPIILTVRVLSGSCLPKPRGKGASEIIDPYVKITLFDVKNEEKEITTTFTTNVVPSNGFFPIWNTEKYLFRIENGSTATLQFSVFDRSSKDELICSASIPINCLRQGVRSVQLFDANNAQNGPYDFASLLIDIKMQKELGEI